MDTPPFDWRNIPKITPPGRRGDGPPVVVPLTRGPELRKSRLTVTDQLSHQPAREQGLGQAHGFVRWLESEDQPWGPRRCRGPQAAGPEWRALDVGWLAEAGVGMVHLVNEAGNPGHVVLTRAQRAEAAKLVIELAVAVLDVGDVFVFARVRPGESIRFEPNDVKAVRVRCPVGQADYTLTAYPA